jgi:hypothetical protein
LISAPQRIIAPLLLLASCRPAPATSLPPPPPPPASSSPLPSPHENPRPHDPRWIQARSDDPLEKARLAVAVGAAGLLAGLADGGETAETALQAIPFADDAEIALGPLAERLRVEPGRRRQILAAIVGVAGQPPRQREPLDPEGARRCGEVLIGLAADASVPREERALAMSAARALAERGYVKREKIPADMDPRGK